MIQQEQACLKIITREELDMRYTDFTYKTSTIVMRTTTLI